MDEFKDIFSISLSGSGIGAVYIGGQQIWPMAISYVITSISASYSSGDKITANASNYYYAVGDINVYRGSTLINTLLGQTLVPYSVSDTSNFNIDTTNNRVTGNHLGTNQVTSSEAGVGYTATVSWIYNTSQPVTSTVKQSSNTATAGNPYISYTNYSAWTYPSTIGATDTSFSVYGTSTYDSTPVYTWTSGSTSYGTTQYGLTTTVTSTITGVTSTPSRSGISYVGNVVTVPANGMNNQVELMFLRHILILRDIRGLVAQV